MKRNTHTVEELRVIEEENTLKRLLGENDLEIEILRELVHGNIYIK